MPEPNTFAVYRRFKDISIAEPLLRFLELNNIEYHLVDNSPTFDITFSNNKMQEEVELMIKQDQFEHVNELLKQQASENLSEVDELHYLYSFSNDELTEIIKKPDEWSAIDYQLAMKILSERGINIDEETAEALRDQRNQDLAQAEHSPAHWLIMGYIFAFLGGLIGIFIGWYLTSARKTLPDGRKVFIYSIRDRWHGKNILYIGIICMVLSLGIQIYSQFR